MQRPKATTLCVLLTLCILLSAAAPAAFAQEAGPRAATAQPRAAAPQAVATGTSFTYQGNLKKSGQPANTTCDFQLGLWDAVTGGSQVGTTQTAPGVTVQGGLFTVQLDFGQGFTGDARWLEIAVQCAGDAGYTTLAPRQSLNAAPYAMGLVPGAKISSLYAGDTFTAEQQYSDTNAIHGKASSSGSIAVWGENYGSTGVYGSSGLGTGVWGASTSGTAVKGVSTSGVGVSGTSNGNNGIEGTTIAANKIGVKGTANVTGGVGVWGESTNTGVYGKSTSGGNGVWGESSYTGVYGISTTSNGVWGESAGGPGVYGHSSKTDGAGLYGSGYVGVQGNSNGTASSQAVRGENFGSNTVGYAGYFNGRVAVFGNLTVNGTLTKTGGSFKIDHPLDPANKYLSHSFVESPDMMNIYNGVVVLDAKGEATVQLPAWFEALNRDFRYQLTCIGGYAPVYISQEVVNNQFKIAGGKTGLKVSWEVTGIRHDPYAEQNRIPVEEDKPAAERGKYIYPQEYGKPASDGMAVMASPAADAAQAPAQGAQP